MKKFACILISVVITISCFTLFPTATLPPPPKTDENGFVTMYEGTELVGYVGPGGDITIPDGIVNIGSRVFASGNPITSVIIPKSVAKIETEIGYSSFYLCTSLVSIDVDPQNLNFSSDDGVLFNRDKTEIVVFPGGKSGEYTISDSVTNTYISTFQNCMNLTAINVSPGNQYFKSQDGVLYNLNIKYLRAYPGGKEGTYVMPDTVIGNYGVFCYNPVITSIVVGKGMTEIIPNSFRDCTSLTSVTIGENVTKIGGEAFRNCTLLSSVEIPDGVTEISADAFRDCTSLSSITIPQSVTLIRSDAFDAATTLTLTWGSYAHAWAVINDQAHVFAPFDDISDVFNVLKLAISGGEFSTSQIAIADVNKDGDITSVDALALLKFILDV